MSKKGITKREEDYSKWYLDIVEHADLAEHSPVKGCMVIKPYGYALWENIQAVLDKMFKETGVKNAYFPMLIPQSFLTREKDHIEGFAPECLTVTKVGDKELDEPYILRPTSETIINETYSKWVNSYRDLPLLINQWANVFRWELRPRLFLRTIEFLWQEGHTVHETEAEAKAKVLEMLEVYRRFAEEYMAMPVICGQKSEAEKFAGAEETYTIEAMMQDGKALQSGTSHALGQNFSKPFNIKYLSREGKLEYAWTTSWGVSTRLVGGLIMAHSDDKGLILPPKIAPIQVVFVPLWKSDEEKEKVMAVVEKLNTELKEKGIRTEIDKRDYLRPGPKFFEWEKKGVPVRVEIGPRDLEGDSVMVARRDTGDKNKIAMADFVTTASEMLNDIQNDLFSKAKNFRDQNLVEIDNYEEFKKLLSDRNGFYLAPWCEETACEKAIQEETKATTRCLPMAQDEIDSKCFKCGKQAKRKVVFAKSY